MVLIYCILPLRKYELTYQRAAVTCESQLVLVINPSKAAPTYNSGKFRVWIIFAVEKGSEEEHENTPMGMATECRQTILISSRFPQKYSCILFYGEGPPFSKLSQYSDMAEKMFS